jgi:hypothetical protein
MTIPLIEQRAIEARIFQATYRSLLAKQGRDEALAVIGRAVEALGFEAGRAFAAKAPNGPSFGHFASIVELWQASGALRIENMHLEPDELAFEVTRCAYLDKYREMGLPEELAGLISCGRDEPFARGYGGQLVFERPTSLATGAPSCRFRFSWGVK